MVPIGQDSAGSVNHTRYRIMTTIPPAGSLQDAINFIGTKARVQEVTIDNTFEDGEEVGATYAVDSRYTIYAEFRDEREALRFNSTARISEVQYTFRHRGTMECPVPTCNKSHTQAEHDRSEKQAEERKKREKDYIDKETERLRRIEENYLQEEERKEIPMDVYQSSNAATSEVSMPRPLTQEQIDARKNQD